MKAQLASPPTDLRRPRADRDSADLRLLRALAAGHVLFGRHEDAAGFLALAAWIDPGDLRTKEIAALVELRRGQVDLAVAAVTELRSAGCKLGQELELRLARATAGGATAGGAGRPKPGARSAAF
jgi:hypothetical protein